MVATSMGYPGNHAERGIVCAQVERHPLEEVEPVVEIGEILEARRLVKAVQVHDEILAYAVAITEATRNHPAVSLGLAARFDRPGQGGPGARRYAGAGLRGARGRQRACS